MGWIGDSKAVTYALSIVGADRDPDGKYLVYGEPPVSFLGLGEELCVPDGTEYTVGGKRCNLAGLMNSTSYGCRNVTVIGDSWDPIRDCPR